VNQQLDRSHDPARTSWVESANGHPDFPIQNLPWGATEDGLVVAIGDMALLLPEAVAAGWGADLPLRGEEFEAPFLNLLLFHEPEAWRSVRLALSDALSDESWRSRLEPCLRSIAELELRNPFSIGDYTDFYASINHATNVGSLFRPDNPLLPNYKWVPIGYHGRSSTVVVDGTPVRRPHGQLRPAEGEPPLFGPCRALDYELELGLVVGGLQQVGEVVPGEDAESRIFGVVLLNDWSARDIQSWEYQPLGPFLAKNFATTISPWVVTTDALLPWRVTMPPRPASDPAPLDYLARAGNAIWEIELAVSLASEAMRSRGESHHLSTVRFDRAMYWSPAQLVTHHASNGCALQAGDLLGTGTISGTTRDSLGCLLEATRRGAESITLADGSSRTFLQDGDEVVMTGRTPPRDGLVPIGFGSCSGVIEAAG